jgi:hypothetical protein
MTIYRASDGSPPPEIRVRHVQTALHSGAEPRVVVAGDQPAGAPVPHPGVAPVAANGGADDVADLFPLKVLAHISRVGDLNGAGGLWVGRPGSGQSVEGFTITPGEGIASDDIEYQAILGNNWSTPWFHGDEFCGSRGLMLPLLGFRVRLLGEAAERYECAYSGHFLGGAVAGPVPGGEACEAGEAPLEALMVTIVPRRGAAAVQPSEVAEAASGDIAGPMAVPELTPAAARPQRRAVKPVKPAAPSRKR